MKLITIEILKDLPGHLAGSEIKIEADALGTPLDRYWRRRLDDAQIDKCCRVKKLKKQKTAKIGVSTND